MKIIKKSNSEYTIHPLDIVVKVEAFRRLQNNNETLEDRKVQIPIIDNKMIQKDIVKSLGILRSMTQKIMKELMQKKVIENVGGKHFGYGNVKKK